MFGADAAKIVGATADPITAVFKGIDSLFTSDEEKLIAEQIKIKILQKPDLMQIELNKIEAQHRSVFVAGWRPFLGWIGGGAMAYQFIIRDLMAWGLSIYDKSIPIPPDLDISDLMTLLMALLGFAGMRTYEKIKGRAK